MSTKCNFQSVVLVVLKRPNEVKGKERIRELRILFVVEAEAAAAFANDSVIKNATAKGYAEIICSGGVLHAPQNAYNMLLHTRSCNKWACALESASNGCIF